jgi:toxin ParE1/3/4
MQIRWSLSAASDLEQIVHFIRSDNPTAAQRVAQTIYDRATALQLYPNQGRQGRVEGTRELALTPLPFIIVYRVQELLDMIEIVNVIHGSQRWPPAK